MPALSDFDIPALEQLLRAWCIPEIHAAKVLRRFYDSGGRIDPTGLPHRLIELIGAKILLHSSHLLARRQSADGTLKLLLGFSQAATADGADDPSAPPQSLSREIAGSVECVLMPSHRPDRAAGCISSQVGCAMGCDFCASTREGLLRNLSAGEIVEQFLHLRSAANELGRRLVTLVFMGMGEPLLNYENVIEAIRRIAGNELGTLGWRQVTVSTVGIIPGILRLARENLGVQLAVSLHAADDTTRQAIVPAGRKYKVNEILEAASHYQQSSGRVVNIEYCLLDGVNDSDDQARLLAQQLAGRRMHVNLIPYNVIGPGISGRLYKTPTLQRMERFAQLLSQAGVVAHFRQTRGQDIDGACGQLRQRQMNPS